MTAIDVVRIWTVAALWVAASARSATVGLVMAAVVTASWWTIERWWGGLR